MALTAAAALAVNVALDAPARIVTEAGTVTAGFPLDRSTFAALEVAFVRLTVQVVFPGGVNVFGVHVRVESTGGPDAFARFITAETAKWSEAARAAGVRK